MRLLPWAAQIVAAPPTPAREVIAVLMVVTGSARLLGAEGPDGSTVSRSRYLEVSGGAAARRRAIALDLEDGKANPDIDTATLPGQGFEHDVPEVVIAEIEGPGGEQHVQVAPPGGRPAGSPAGAPLTLAVA